MVIQPWLLPSLVSLLMWGTIGILSKEALKRFSALEVVLYYAPIYCLLAIGIQFFYGIPQFTAMGVVFALITGIIGTVAQLLGLQAMQHGPVTRIVIIISLYPMVATLLAVFFLHETLSLKQVAGIILGVGSICLLAAPDKKTAGVP